MIALSKVSISAKEGGSGVDGGPWYNGRKISSTTTNIPWEWARERISCWRFGESMVPVGLFGLFRTIIFVFGFMRAFRAVMSRRFAAPAPVVEFSFLR